VGLSETRLDALIEAGLDHIQLSFQDIEERQANEFAGTRAHSVKLRLMETIRRRRIGFTINIVVHRQNLDRLNEMVAFAEESGAQRLEIANVQYYGWALRNGEALLPTREQLRRCMETLKAARDRLQGRLRIEFLLPDYYARYPKPCMNGGVNWYSSIRRAMSSRAMRRAVFRAWSSQTFVSAHCAGFGRSRRPSNASVVKTGCRSLAGVATTASAISAGAVARRFCSPAMRPRRTPSVYSRRSITSSKKCFRV
jgi:hypothetical protein